MVSVAMTLQSLQSLTAAIDSIQGFPGGLVVRNPPANPRDSGLIPGWGDPLEKEMATLSSILA